MKVLINAYACSPYRGSEPGMGWNFVRSLSRLHELHIITEQDEFQWQIEKYFKEHPEEQKYYHFHYVKRINWDVLRKIWPPSYYWTYAIWQREALKLAERLDAEEHFDVIHQLNMVGFREPGYLWKMNKPLVWGPMGNFNITPWCLLPVMGWYGMLFYAVRNVMNWWQARFSARVRKATSEAKALICVMEDDRKVVKRLYGRDAVVMPEVGLMEFPPEEQRPVVRTPSEKMRIAWSGIHVQRKALPLLLKAMKHCAHKDEMELHIIGEGPCTGAWKRIAEKQGIANVVWHGQVCRDEALRIMRQSHVFALTSLSEATSTVLLEALSLHLPVVALNHLGFAGVVNESCGIKIEVENPSQISKDFAVALDKLFENEKNRQMLSDGAYKRALEYSWEEKARMIDEIYHKCVI